MKRGSFLVILAFITLSLFPQNQRNYKDVLNTKVNYSNTNNATGLQLFKMLASSTNAGIRNIEVDIKYRVIISKSDKNLRTGITKIGINSNFEVRDFNISEKLWPSYIDGNILYGDDKIPVSVPFSGEMTTITDKTFSNEKRLEFEPVNFVYSDSQLIDIKRVISEINEYHSLLVLLHLFEKSQKEISGKAKLLPSIVFSNKIETFRISNIIDKFKSQNSFSEDMDPKNMSSDLSKYARLNTRTNTLFNKYLKLSSDVNDFLEFCRLYTNLSIDKLNMLDNMQPNNGIAIRASANVIEKEFSILNEIAAYYLENYKIESKTFYTTLFNMMGEASKQQLELGENNKALFLLINAIDIAKFGNIPLPDWTNKLLLDISEGIITSYLRVGYMSLKMGNTDLALNYFTKCDSLIFNHIVGLPETQVDDSSFVDFIETESKILNDYIFRNDFSNALKTLEREDIIATSIKLHCIHDSLKIHKTLLYNSYFQNLIYELKNVLSEKQYHDAYCNFMEITTKHNNYALWLNANSKNEFNKTATELFDVFITQGELLTEENQPLLALDNLLIAKEIQPFLSEKSIIVDSLIHIAAQPAILDLIEEASFHVWANRLSDANQMLLQTESMSAKHFNNKNQLITDAINRLRNNITYRKCLSYKIKLHDIISTINISFKDKNFNRCYDLFLEADLLIDSTLFCNNNTIEYHQLKAENKYFIQYYEKLDMLTKLLYNNGYSKIIPLYFELGELYNKHIIKNYNIQFYSIENFIIKQNLPLLTAETIRWYLDNYNPREAIKFIEIYRKQGGQSKDIRELINRTAYELAVEDDKNNVPRKEALKNYTDGESWYLGFKINYVKNRFL